MTSESSWIKMLLGIKIEPWNLFRIALLSLLDHFLFSRSHFNYISPFILNTKHLVLKYHVIKICLENSEGKNVTAWIMWNFSSCSCSPSILHMFDTKKMIPICNIDIKSRLRWCRAHNFERLWMSLKNSWKIVLKHQIIL